MTKRYVKSVAMIRATLRCTNSQSV
jgi:hypothetical protein